jgi:hypothetical protein
MKAKVLGGFLIVSMLVGAMISAVPTAAAPPPPDYKPVDAGPELREWEATPERIEGGLTTFTAAELDALEAEAMAAVAGTPYDQCVLDAKLWLALDDFNGAYFFDTFYLVSETTGSELWVQVDLSWPEGDPRNDPMVTCEQADYLLGEFDSNMYPTETSFFGTPDFHDGTYSLLEAWGYVPAGYYSNAAGRQVVLVSNVRDDNYYDPTYPNYIAGFYSPTYEAYFDRNIMNIDSYDWANRVGPDGSRPYLYEGVFAHEYQHLLHDDYDPYEVNWVNEGLSMFAEFLTGYTVGNDAYSTFEELPENSLTAWGDQGGREIVADYGMVFLWHMFMYQNFGEAFIQNEFLNTDTGITSINSTLLGLGETATFESVFPNFSVAVLIDSEENDFEYGFDYGFDVGVDVGPPGKPNPDAYDTPGAPPWGSDYIALPGQRSIHNFVFNGVQFNPTAWTSNGDALYSGDGDLIDNIAVFEATGGGTLTFDTYWDIEDNWDFGFVQVSTDGGYTWTSLANAYTTDVIDPDGHPDIAANLPGLTSWSCFVEADCWVNMSFDLSAYPGDILLAFRYMTDWAFTYEGWYVDNVYVDDTLISDGSSIDPFMSLNELFKDPENAFTITFVGERNRKGESEYKVLTVPTDNGYELEWNELRDMFKNYRSVVMIVTSNAEEGVTDYAPYDYQLLSGGNMPFKNKPPR